MNRPRVQGLRHRRRALALGGAGLATLGVCSTYASAPNVSLNGLEGPTNGLLVILLAVLAGLSAGRRDPTRLRAAVALAASVAAVWTVLSDVLTAHRVLDGHAGWGAWAAILGLAAIAASALLAAAGPHGAPRTGRRRVPGIAAAVLAAVLFLVWQQVLTIAPDDRWPPSADAVTPGGAQAATEAFAARNDVGPHDADLEFAPTTATTMEPWVEGKRFFPRILDDVGHARASVHILMFGWREGEIGKEMAALLEQRLAAGVEVRIIVDSFGSRPYGAAEEMYRHLADAGAEIVVNDVLPLDRDGLYPDGDIDLRHDELGRADHRKLYVVDGNVMWTGGAGIEDHFRNGGFHDVMARITGPVVLQAQAAFLTSFHGYGGPLPQGSGALERFFPRPPAGAIPIVLAQVLPGGFTAASQAIREQIDGARERLDVMNAYLTDADMIDRIMAAARRGVRVRVVVSEESNNPQATAALRHRYGALLASGVGLYEYPGAVVHAKVVVADDVVSVGTVNLDSWALYRNSEIAVIARSADVAARFEQRLFEPDIARSHSPHPPTGLRDRLGNWLWDKLTYFL